MKNIIGLSILAIIVGAFGGWVANIVKIAALLGDANVTTMFVARIVGVFVAPLGAVLGYF